MHGSWIKELRFVNRLAWCAGFQLNGEHVAAKSDELDVLFPKQNEDLEARETSLPGGNRRVPTELPTPFK